MALFSNRIATAARLLVLLSVTRLSAQKNAPSVPAKNFVRVNGVKYAQGQAAPLLADVYLPKESGLHPAIIFVHGGGWVGGSRENWSELIAPFAQQGYVGVANDYDLSPAVHFPTALLQCKESVRWLRAHASEFHVDPKRIAIAGGSAGGELAALVALTGEDTRYQGTGAFQTFSSSVKAAVLYSSDLDLTKFSETDSSIHAYLGGSCAEKRELCLQASPQFNLTSPLPPIFIGHGNADEDVPFSQFTSFVEAYKKASGPITTFVAEQGPHSYAAKPQWFQRNVDAVLQFLKANL